MTSAREHIDGAGGGQTVRPSILPTIEPQPIGTFLVQPLSALSDGTTDVGALIGYRNKGRLSPWEWQVDLRGLARHLAGETRPRWQLDGELDPALPNLHGHPLSLALSGFHNATQQIDEASGVSAEPDLTVTTSPLLNIGLVKYYDWSHANGELSSEGTTNGVIAYLERGRFSFSPEYDLSSGFNDGDYFIAIASALVYETPSGVGIRVRGSWEKGSILGVRIQIGVPDNRHDPARKLTR